MRLLMHCESSWNSVRNQTSFMAHYSHDILFDIVCHRRVSGMHQKISNVSNAFVCPVIFDGIHVSRYCLVEC